MWQNEWETTRRGYPLVAVTPAVGSGSARRGNFGPTTTTTTHHLIGDHRKRGSEEAARPRRIEHACTVKIRAARYCAHPPKINMTTIMVSSTRAQCVRNATMR